MILISSDVIKESGIQFGTSGARGLVSKFTANVCAAFTHAFVSSMSSRFAFNKVAIAIDNRPSSYAMAQACTEALTQLGIETVYYGVIPTPALAYVAMQDQIPSIMVTGSHIPFDRNGLKFYRPDGEISKLDESAILNSSAAFNTISNLPKIDVDTSAAERYVDRYLSIFDGANLRGKKIGIYEHSSAGRDIYAKLFKRLGAEVVSLERSDKFVPIDTEAVSESDRQKAKDWSRQYGFDAIFSTDGDGDRPLVADESGQWLRGDILGLLCAQALNIEALAIPVSCNSAVELSGRFVHVSKTKIGSPYVIAEFEQLTKKYTSIAGFEANGGFLLGSDVLVNGNVIKALPTRDAVLPILIVLASARYTTISQLVNELPSRYTHSDRLQNFQTEKSIGLLEVGKHTPSKLLDLLGLEEAEIVGRDTTDGLRLTFSDQNIVHLRPSGNAPELRCYAESNNVEQAKRLVDKVLASVSKL
jgi:phosphomannomutase